MSEYELSCMFCDGGYGYWGYMLKPDNYEEVQEKLKKDGKDSYSSDIIAHIIFNGGTVIMVDDEEEIKHELTLKKLNKGVRKNKKERPWDCDLENPDCTTWDCIIQYALFNELVYG